MRKSLSNLKAIREWKVWERRERSNSGPVMEKKKTIWRAEKEGDEEGQLFFFFFP